MFTWYVTPTKTHFTCTKGISEKQSKIKDSDIKNYYYYKHVM